MTTGSLLKRSLVYHRRIHLWVAMGVAVGAAVLAGALLVGDSVRGSLRDLTLDRLGEIDHALVADRYFRRELASEVAASEGFRQSFGKIAAAILIRGSVESADGGGRASRVNIHGVDESFWNFYRDEPVELGPRDVALNESLAREVSAEKGDAVLLRFQADTAVPSESVMGRKTENVRTMRLQVAKIIPDRGPGRFGLSPSQQLPLNAFLPVGALERPLEQRGRANALFVSGDSSEEGAAKLRDLLKSALTLDDLNLSVRELPRANALALETSRIVLDQKTAQSATDAAQELGLNPKRVLTYLANSIESGGRSIPYSTVTAIDTPHMPDPPNLAPLAVDRSATQLTLTDGPPAPALVRDELLLNEWAARDLNAKTGDTVKLTYYTVGSQGALNTESHDFTLRGVVKLDGLALDRNLAPTYKGMSDAARMDQWDPPFPVDLSLIRPADETYWEDYRTAPKAFIALNKAKELWTSRFGQLSSLRLELTRGYTIPDAREKFQAALHERLDPSAYGLDFQPVKAQGLAASSGATDFSGLFIGFSFFIIISAALLVVLLYRLGVEKRAREIGLLLSSGQRVPDVRRMLLHEGAIVAAVGCLIGLPLAVGYGALMVYGLRTWWSAAVGGSFLELHVGAASLAGGAIGAFALMSLSIWFSLRRLEKMSPRSMLAGALEDGRGAEARARRARRPRLVAIVCTLVAIALLGASFATDAVPAVGAFFGIGALLLIACLAFFRARLATPARAAICGKGAAPLLRLGARNGARYPTRSVLSAALIASATFIVVTVAVNQKDVTKQEPSFNSGDGGFRLIAESDVPLYQTQLDPGASGETAGAKIFPFRVKPGEDASCLNLYSPSNPTLLGATTALIERGGFAFGGTLAGSEAERSNPWRLLETKREDGAIPVFGDANSVQWILHLGLGQELNVEDAQGSKRRLVIAGMMPHSLFQSQLIMSEANFLELYPSHSGYNLFLIESPAADLATKLEERFSEYGFDATSTGDYLAGFLVVENTYLSTFQTLGGLGLLLGTLGLAVVMVRNVVERRGELALLQAIGFRTSSISWLVFAENALVLVFGVVIGTVTALLAVAPHLMSGLAEPPWEGLLLTLAAILAVGLLAGGAAVYASVDDKLASGLRRE